jgi:uncharacterized protein with NRDE domain
MCTVTFIPVKDTFFLTSNRDEKIFRKPAFPPVIQWENGSGMLYPKDADAGGSWICMHENGNAAVLLNGAFSKHISTGNYRQSRGIIFLEIIRTEKPVETFIKINLVNIEPFTIIIFDNNYLYECRWDGYKKYYVQLQNDRPYIWSSATLYETEAVKKREEWFTHWLKQNPHPTQEDILYFHQFTGKGDFNNGLKINREEKMITVSITGIAVGKNTGCMKYIDLKNNNIYSQQFSFRPLQHVA